MQASVRWTRRSARQEIDPHIQKGLQGALQGTMVSPPVKLAIPLLFNLYTNPREDQDKVITDSWIFGVVLKMVGEFEAGVKKYPLIAMGTLDP